MLNLNKCTKPKPKPTLIFKNCSCTFMCISLHTTVIYNTAQNSADNFPFILQTIIMAETMSTGGRGGAVVTLVT